MDPDQERESSRPDTDAPPGDEPAHDAPRMSGREMFAQLHAMASQVAGDAPPALREAAARAAELAAEAARNARPFSERVLDATSDATSKFADRSERFAADLRRHDERSRSAASDEADHEGAAPDETSTPDD